MGRQSKQKACFSCVESKRRCNKTLPSCSRCNEKDINCAYPPVQRWHNPHRTGLNNALDLTHGEAQASSRLRHQGDILCPQDVQESQDRTLGHPTSSTDLIHTVSSSYSSFPPSTMLSPATIDLLAAGQLASYPGDLGWFLHPSAWTIAYHYQPPASLPSGPNFSNFIRGLQTWLSRFLRTGHNPFIHRHLYSGAPMPKCMQDAYSAISLSQNVTQSNEHIVDEISSFHISNLIACQPIEDLLSFPLLSTRDHLARTQALLIHLLLALFSSSIPRRATSERLIETLIHWTDQLWESASRDAAAALLCPGSLSLTNGGDGYTTDSVLGLYGTFALSESIRRTWLLCRIATGVYYSHKGEWSSPCSGDVCITTRAELWDATSPARWESLVRNQDPLFIHSLHGQSLVARGVGASQVDEFARHLFTVMWGMDKVEDWVVRTGDAVSIIY